MKFEKQLIYTNQFDTKLGTMRVCATARGICLLEFTDPRMAESSLKKLAKHADADLLYGENIHTENLRREVTEYFEGRLKEFLTPLHTNGTEFQKSVWRELLKIPYGETRSYKQQAAALGNPGAVRAVARANGMNKIAILIPCHRVIGDSGNLTGYGGGLWRKKWLLDLENAQTPDMNGLNSQLTLFSEDKSTFHMDG